MKVTSMLSNGYLQPLRSALRLMPMEEERVFIPVRDGPKNIPGDIKQAQMPVFPGISSLKAWLLFERLHEENRAAGGYAASIAEKFPDSAMIDLREAYRRTSSRRGLWTLERGFEPGPKIFTLRRTAFDIAA